MAKRLKDAAQKSEAIPQEVIKRMEEFPKRREKFIATIRKGKN